MFSDQNFGLFVAGHDNQYSPLTLHLRGMLRSIPNLQGVHMTKRLPLFRSAITSFVHTVDQTTGKTPTVRPRHPAGFQSLRGTAAWYVGLSLEALVIHPNGVVGEENAAYQSALSSTYCFQRFEEELGLDAAQLREGAVPAELIVELLWRRGMPETPIRARWNDLSVQLSEGDVGEQFWQRWYDGMLNGNPVPIDLQRQVVLIDNEIWEAGPKAVAEEIARIEAEFRSVGDVPIPKDLEERLRANAPMVAILQAAGRENLTEAREKLRGDNGVTPETRDKLNECLDRLEAALNDLVEVLGLPSEAEDFSARTKKWWRDFCRSNGELSREYSSAENLSKATFPTALILSCTAIGSFFGQPLAGSVVGGLIAQQMKPSQAAKELGKPNETG